MRKRWFGMISLMIVLSLVLIACSDDSEETKTNESNNTEETEEKASEGATGGELSIAIPAQPPTLDAQMTVSTAALNIARHIYETLVTLNENYEPVPMLAESVDMSDDGTTYTFTLREGITFHNGEELTTEDVVASMNRWLETSSRAKLLLEEASFEESGENEVTLQLQERAADVLDIMAGQSEFPAIMPKEVIESADETGVTEYIGTGPFQFEEWRQDQYVHLSKFEDYQALESERSGLSGKKEALVDDIYFEIVTDPSTRVAGLQTGTYDIADEIPFETYEQVESMEGVNTHLYFNRTLTWFYNTNEGVMADQKMREAINTALNIDEIMQASYMNEDVYELNPGHMNLNQVNWASEAGMDSYNINDTEKAQELLDEAGYDGEQITIITTRDYGYMYNAAIVVQEQLNQLGMNVEVENYDLATFLELKNQPSEWDMFAAGTGYVTIPAQLLALNPGFAGLDDPTAQEMLAEVRTAETPEDAYANWDELQGYLYDSLSTTVFGHQKDIIATSDNVQGFEPFQAPILWDTTVSE
ncbi:ABC transporter substrate-binding protein [Saliterribacillus persicus]|uniref:Peptide/nickel transport system substrate-binding protein n=1 Tax=Saliterribacillus persicus TaxID=930114 RepID=A0A368Y9B3_9BACI|nr:ABC transporter substrate-binding protein [Saliterribacillus persicus]RCW76861.1 peptide/nickel transport system substrate-binding protein [Saliterribacillus persicus]